jgi:hypothetical protein
MNNPLPEAKPLPAGDAAEMTFMECIWERDVIEIVNILENWEVNPAYRDLIEWILKNCAEEDVIYRSTAKSPNLILPTLS